LRVTGPRRAVLQALDEHPHETAGAVAGLVRARLDRVSTQAVYDVLAAFTRSGLARKIEPAGFPALYETRTGDNHHHLVCRTCGSVTDVDYTIGDPPCLAAGEHADYRL